MHRSLILRNWRRTALRQRAQRQTLATIERGYQLRLALGVLQAWRRRRLWHNDVTNKMRAVVDRMRNSTLSRAFNKWAEATRLQQLKQEQLKHAMAFWTNRWVPHASPAS